MAANSNFGDLPAQYATAEKAKIVIVPVPYDGTSTWIKGADRGPGAIIAASANMELYDIETACEVYKTGIFTDEPVTEAGSPEDMVSAVRERTDLHLKGGKFVVLLGGEHSVSIGSIRAHAERYEDLTVLQLDAHADLRAAYNGSKFNHACVMARAREVAPIVQVGIRSMDSSERQFIDDDRIFFAKDIHDNRDWFCSAISKLTEKVYITIDLDVFDPSIMPSTGTPEPGGISWYDCLALLKNVAAQRDIVGFDVVELCPAEYNKAPDFLAAKLVYKLLSYKFGA
ncbi:MAG TPA: agmatinase [Proteobacteria bacterium]|nr:agmatinase [Pseudomonadota bacterium]